MTTIVKVSAHCASNKEVLIKITDHSQGSTTEQVIQDGEMLEVYAYDSRVVQVYEREKGVA